MLFVILCYFRFFIHGPKKTGSVSIEPKNQNTNLADRRNTGHPSQAQDLLTPPSCLATLGDVFGHN